MLDERRHLVGAVALGGRRHALAVDARCCGRPRVRRPRIDHVGHLVGRDRVAGAEAHGVAAVEIHVGAGAEQRGGGERQDRRPRTYFETWRSPLATSRMWPIGGAEPSERPLMRRSIGTVISAWPSRKNSAIVRRLRGVERRAQHVAGTRRAHDARRHDDDEVGFLLLVGGAARERAEHRHVGEPGQLLLVRRC